MYWITGDTVATGALVKCPVAGCNGNPTVLVEGLQPGDGVGRMAADAENVYWTNTGFSSDGTVTMCAKAGCNGMPTVLASGVAPCDIAVDAANVYWADAGGIWAVPKAGGAHPRLVCAALVDRIAVDETNVYSTFAENGTVLRCALGDTNGATTQLANGQVNASGIVLDDTSIYWVTQGNVAPGSWSSVGSLMKLPK